MIKSVFSSSDPKILELLYANNNLTREDLAKEIGVSSDAIKHHLSNLQKDKLLTRIGGRKDGYWKVLGEFNVK